MSQIRQLILLLESLSDAQMCGKFLPQFKLCELSSLTLAIVCVCVHLNVFACVSEHACVCVSERERKRDRDIIREVEREGEWATWSSIAKWIKNHKLIWSMPELGVVRNFILILWQSK